MLIMNYYYYGKCIADPAYQAIIPQTLRWFEPLPPDPTGPDTYALHILELQEMEIL